MSPQLLDRHATDEDSAEPQAEPQAEQHPVAYAEVASAPKAQQSRQQSRQQSHLNPVTSAPSWQFGFAVALAMLSLLVVVLMGIATFLSPPSSSLYVIDSFIAVSIVALSAVLFLLLGRVGRR